MMRIVLFGKRASARPNDGQAAAPANAAMNARLDTGEQSRRNAIVVLQSRVKPRSTLAGCWRLRTMDATATHGRVHAAAFGALALTPPRPPLSSHASTRMKPPGLESFGLIHLARSMCWLHREDPMHQMLRFIVTLALALPSLALAQADLRQPAG